MDARLRAHHESIAAEIATLEEGSDQYARGPETFGAPESINIGGCGGLVITRRYVLGAAHCARLAGWLPDFPDTRTASLDTLRVTFNSGLNQTQSIVTSGELIVHPDFEESNNARDMYTDLYVVRLDEDLPAELAYRARLYTGGFNDESGCDALPPVFVFGWGLQGVKSAVGRFRVCSPEDFVYGIGRRVSSVAPFFTEAGDSGGTAFWVVSPEVRLADGIMVRGGRDAPYSTAVSPVAAQAFWLEAARDLDDPILCETYAADVDGFLVEYQRCTSPVVI